VWKSQTFLQCPGCQLLVRNQTIDQQGLDSLYQNSWSAPYQELSETGATTDNLANQYASLLEKSLPGKSLKGLKILDFGAGRGAMSVALQRVGADVTAVEPYGYDFLKEQGIPAYRDMQAATRPGGFDGIVSLDVIEHLSSPWDDLLQMKDGLAPGGWIFIATPNRDSLNARIFGSVWREAQRPGHLLLFNPASLRRVLTGAGFQNVRQLHWDVAYSTSPLVRVKDWVLRSTQLDGELRFLGYKAQDEALSMRKNV
jgi:SAM-dependent methyltransferase